MIIWLPLLGLMLVLVYFLYFGRRDDTRSRFRERYRERMRSPRPEQPIDTNFQFDSEPGDSEPQK